MLRDAAVLGAVFALTTGCGSSTSPTGPTPLPVTIQDVGGSRHLTESGGHTYAIWATVVTRAAVTGAGEVTVTLSGGAAPPQTYREPRVFSLPPGSGMLDFQIPDQAGVAHTMVQVTIALSDTGGHPQATGSGALVDIVAPALTASADRTALSAGETTTLRWRATGNGGVAVSIDPIAGVIFPAEGSTEITPCPGTTVFESRDAQPLRRGARPGSGHGRAADADTVVLRDVVGREHRDVDRFGRHAGVVVGRRGGVRVPVGRPRDRIFPADPAVERTARSSARCPGRPVDRHPRRDRPGVCRRLPG